MQVKRLTLALLAMSALACGSSWTDSDARSVIASARAQAMALSLCAPDAGTCQARQVRALEKASFCDSQATLFRHDLPPVFGGVECRPR